jgi:hypothetical protein
VDANLTFHLSRLEVIVDVEIDTPKDFVPSPSDPTVKTIPDFMELRCSPRDPSILGLFIPFKCEEVKGLDTRPNPFLYVTLDSLFATLFAAYKEEAIRGETEKSYKTFYKIMYLLALVEYLRLLRVNSDCDAILHAKYKYDCVKTTLACKFKLNLDDFVSNFVSSSNLGIDHMTILEDTVQCNPFTIHL